MDNEITLQDLLNMFKRNVGLAIVVTLACFLITAVYVLFIAQTRYTMTASLNSPSQIANVNSYLTAWDSEQSVASQMQITDLDDFKISSSVTTTSNTATVSVTGPRSEDVAKMANGLVQNAVKMAKERLKIDALVTAPTEANDVKVSPNRATYLGLGLFGGMFLAVCIILIKEMGRSSFSSVREVESNLGLPVLGSLSKDDSNFDLSKGHLHNGAVQLANNIGFFLKSNAKHSIAFVSETRDGSQATTAAELAIALGMQGKYVVLLDADMDNRPLASMLPCLRGPVKPLSSYLNSGAGDVSEVVGRTIVAKLHVVYADSGIPCASLVYTSEAFRELVQKLSAVYDCVVINAPLGLLVDDAVKVASSADATVLVASCEGARRSDTVKLCGALAASQVNLIGTVLTRVGSRDVVSNRVEGNVPAMRSVQQRPAPRPAAQPVAQPAAQPAVQPAAQPAAMRPVQVGSPKAHNVGAHARKK